MNSDANAKIKMLNGSTRCLIYGLLALIPLFGFPFAIASLWISGQVRAKEKIFWNAARPYRIWGVVCAAVGIIFWSGILMFVVFQVANSHDSNNYNNYGSGD